MNTLFDFVTHVNGLGYLLAIAFLGGFVIFLEILKPKPFVKFMASVSEDLNFMREKGLNAQFMKNVATAPFIFLVYLASIPLMFAQALGLGMVRGVSAVTSVGWSPIEAYFTGKKKKVKGKSESQNVESGK